MLVEQIRSVHRASDETYGMPRVRAQLQHEGQCVSRKRVARLMRVACIRGVSRRRGFTVTTERYQKARPAPDLVNREFRAEAPNQLWVADMTYVPTWSGFLFLAVVLDAFSRKVVGWAMSDNMTAELVLAALNMALQTRKPAGVIHHSDQGSPVHQHRVRQALQGNGREAPMGTVGDAYDNAMVESFFASLECELIDRRCWQTKAAAKIDVFTYIEGWYNPRRLHSSLGYLSPIQFEEKHGAYNDRACEDGFPTAAVGSSQAPTAAVENTAHENA